MAKHRFQLPDGEFGTLLADPPWDYGDGPSVRRRIKYDRMSVDEIKAIPVRDICIPDAHLWLWTTTAHLKVALDVVEAWGFDYKTLVTWPKSRLGLGWWLRNKTEHAIFAARSTKFRANPGSLSNLLPSSYHGEAIKPPSLYDLIEKISPGPYLELFSSRKPPGERELMAKRQPEREPREGWHYVAADGVPVNPFGQYDHGAHEDPTNGIVRGFHGFEPIVGKQAVWLEKVMVPHPVEIQEVNGRRITIIQNGKTKTVSIDRLREADYVGQA
jgi:N6-adenosine-specific RNA methylase IME4